jgi:hypothetical protein
MLFFTVDTDGTQHIENLAILPGTDNFNFETSRLLQALGEFFLEDKIEPSGIGKTLTFTYEDASKLAYLSTGLISSLAGIISNIQINGYIKPTQGIFN